MKLPCSTSWLKRCEAMLLINHSSTVLQNIQFNFSVSVVRAACLKTVSM